MRIPVVMSFVLQRGIASLGCLRGKPEDCFIISARKERTGHGNFVNPYANNHKLHCQEIATERTQYCCFLNWSGFHAGPVQSIIEWRFRTLRRE